MEIFATLEPAREIGGDLYDFFWGEDGRLYFVVADVSGKGAPAALFMARIKTMMRLVATLYREPDGEAGRARAHHGAKINEDVCVDNRQDMFVTVFFGILDPRTGTLTYCNAGHNTPYMIGKKRRRAACRARTASRSGSSATTSTRPKRVQLAAAATAFSSTPTA